MKPLSDRLLQEVGYWPKTSTLDSLLREAAALAKSVESAPVAVTEQVGPTIAYVYFEEPPGPLKRECVLVPLPQQSES